MLTGYGQNEATYSPEVVDKKVEDGQDDDEESGAELGLETDDNHDAGDGADQGHGDPPGIPGAAEDEADEEEDEQDATSELEVHLAVLLVELGNASEGLALADERVGENHDQAANDGQVTEEEVDVENETVSQGLSDDDGNEAGDGVVRVLADDDEDGAGRHDQHVGEKENVGDAIGNYRHGQPSRRFLAEGGIRTAPVVIEVEQLVAPLGEDSEHIFEEGDDDEEPADGGKVTEGSKHVSTLAQSRMGTLDLDAVCLEVSQPGPGTRETRRVRPTPAFWCRLTVSRVR
jgi:hypothetical protein